MTNKPNVKFIVSATFEMLDGGPDEEQFLDVRMAWTRNKFQAIRLNSLGVALKWFSLAFCETRCVAAKISEAE